MFLAIVAGVCQDATGGRKGTGCSNCEWRDCARTRTPQHPVLAVSSDYDETGLPRRCVVLRSGSHVALSGFETKPPVELDRLNIITIDTHLDVRPDSMALLRAAREVVEEPDFQEMLDSVRGRVDEIESLHRTRELTVCVGPYRSKRM